MRRKTKERLAAVALTLLVLGALFELAGTYAVEESRPQYRALRFGIAYRAPSRPLSGAAPAVTEAPQRVAIDAAAIPHSRRTTLAQPHWPDVRTSGAAVALQGSKAPARTAIAGRTTRSLLPRTRLPRQRAVALVPVPVEPGRSQLQPRRTAPAPQQRVLPPVTQRRAPPPEQPVPAANVEPEDLDSEKIIDWMNLQPAVLPPGIRRHIEYREGALTSIASVVHDGIAYDLYLMAHLAVRELHVVLVTGASSYYLIDRSFHREGRSFRAGTVRRSGDVITGIVSEERAAGSEPAQHFYRVFLSWWDAEQLRLQ